MIGGGPPDVAALSRRFIDHWNGRDIDAILGSLAADVVYQNLPLPEMIGHEAVRSFITPNLLRVSRSTGSLRLLFLDEANRLSQDNLAVLFDLCQTLDLQLLIAAPEVALAEGNTTYRLVRLTTGEGREEVRVTGRRPRAEA